MPPLPSATIGVSQRSTKQYQIPQHRYDRACDFQHQNQREFRGTRRDRGMMTNKNMFKIDRLKSNCIKSLNLGDRVMKLFWFKVCQTILISINVNVGGARLPIDTSAYVSLFYVVSYLDWTSLYFYHTYVIKTSTSRMKLLFVCRLLSRLFTSG